MAESLQTNGKHVKQEDTKIIFVIISNHKSSVAGFAFSVVNYTTGKTKTNKKIVI